MNFRLSDARFYTLLTFVAMLVSGVASIRWPSSALAQGYQPLSYLFTASMGAVMGQAFNRSQKYFQDQNKTKKADDTEK